MSSFLVLNGFYVLRYSFNNRERTSARILHTVPLRSSRIYDNFRMRGGRLSHTYVLHADVKNMQLEIEHTPSGAKKQHISVPDIQG